MITTENLTLKYGSRALFKEVTLKFTQGNCYGIIGANGSGKSSFLKIISKEIEPSSGSFTIEKNKRIAILKQNQDEFNEYTVLDTVLKGHKKIFEIIEEKNKIYEKENFTDEDGLKLAELEEEFLELNGYDADVEAEKLLRNLGIEERKIQLKMNELEGSDKVKVLLAQALFYNPDILIMDEPTNNLDAKTKLWLENFLANYENLILLVSHDRHFLDNICTHIVNIDRSQMKIYTGNYSFWKEASKIADDQLKNQNKKIEAKREELISFIQRFSANASKSKQATSRKNLLEKLKVEEIEPSSRRYPHIFFKPTREVGDKILEVTDLKDNQFFQNISFTVNKGDKIAFLGNKLAISSLFDILTSNNTDFAGTFEWGITTSQSYFPKGNTKYFEENLNLIDWLRQFAQKDSNDDNFLRGFLGKMLFSGEETLKQTKVLSGGEKVRCMFSKIMLEATNVIIFDEPTNHLDIESISSLNDGVIGTKCIILFASQDFEFVNTSANRIIEICKHGSIDRNMPYEEYVRDAKIDEIRKKLN